ncbi:MAG: ATP-binding protein [Ktedonobacterales bacterium]
MSHRGHIDHIGHIGRMRSLTWKLSLAFLLVSVTGALVAAIFIWQATQHAFQNDALAHAQSEFITQMAGYYQYHHSWDGVAEYARTLAPPNQNPNPNGPPRPPNYPAFVLVDTQHHVVLPGHTHYSGELITASEYARGSPVKVNNQVVGVVLEDSTPPPLSAADMNFLASIESALILGGLAAVLVALALGIVLARSLTRPLRELTLALHAMAGGDLQQVAPVRSRDELGQLATAFNSMSANLAAANAQRRQMTADIAHELRTPVTVIAGYLEALRDGVLPPSPERFAILYDEAQHLRHLIEDLRTLSLADAGELTLQPQSIAPRVLLERITGAYQHQAERQGVALAIETEDETDDREAIPVDVERMTQVLSNLVNNALRYTPNGGAITLGATATPQGTYLQVRDTGQGIPPDALPHIFDRFYRADVARSHSQEASGLGLAIAKALVEAHGGTIDAQSQPDSGATFSIFLPTRSLYTAP